MWAEKEENKLDVIGLSEPPTLLGDWGVEEVNIGRGLLPIVNFE